MLPAIKRFIRNVTSDCIRVPRSREQIFAVLPVISLLVVDDSKSVDDATVRWRADAAAHGRNDTSA